MNSNKNYSIFNSDEYYVPEKKEKDPIMFVAWLIIALVVVAFVLNGVLEKKEAEMERVEASLQNK